MTTYTISTRSLATLEYLQVQRNHFYNIGNDVKAQEIQNEINNLK